jgi:hypothetical protein
MCLHLPSQRVYIFRHVIFHEEIFPFKHPILNSTFVPVYSNTQTLTVLPLATSTSTIQSIPPSPLQSTPQHPPSSSHHMITRQKTNSLKPKSFPNHQVHNTNLSALDTEPTSYTQAAKHSQWRQTIASELTALALNSTWELLHLPPNAHSVGCK